MKTLNLIGCAAAAFTLSLAAHAATTYYVSTNGDDSNAGTSEETALATPAKGVSKAKTAGDTVILLPGTYQMSGNLSTSTTDMTIKGATDNPRDVVLDFQGLCNSVSVGSADGIVISSLTISNSCESSGTRWHDHAIGIALGNRTEPTESGKTKLVTNCVITCCAANSQNKERILQLDVTSRVVDCVIENNTNSGGASGYVVRMYQGGELVNCTITNNSGVGVYGTLACTNLYATSMVVRGCTIRNNAGRGVQNVPTVRDSWIEGHSANNGAGFLFENGYLSYLPDDFRVTVSNTTFVGNTATGYGYGAAAYLDKCGELIGCTMSNNVGTVVYGNATSASATSIVVRACTIRNNTGRCLYNIPTVRDSWIEGGSAVSGAGIYLHPEILGYLPADFLVTISNTTFFANAATTGFGGAFSWGNWSTVISNVVIDSCAFISNTLNRASDGNRGGGAIFINPCTLGDNVVIRNSLFEGNAQLNAGSALPGAAIHITREVKDIGGGGTIRIENCSFVGNRNESGNDNSVYLTGRYSTPIATVTNCVFASNIKVVDGVETETAGLEVGASYVGHSYLYPASTTTFDDTVINGTKVPKFQEGTWIPGAGSPLRDKGIVLPWMAGAYDLQRKDGKPFRERILGSAPDLGCYEYKPLGFLLFVR